MDFNFEIKETKEPILTTLSVPVSEEMKAAIQNIKKSKGRNGKFINDLLRQFLCQLIEKYQAGSLDQSNTNELGKILK